METDLNILKGNLTAYQISEAIGISIEEAADLLEQRITVESLDEESQEKLKQLEAVLFDYRKNSVNILNIKYETDIVSLIYFFGGCLWTR